MKTTQTLPRLSLILEMFYSGKKASPKVQMIICFFLLMQSFANAEESKFYGIYPQNEFRLEHSKCTNCLYEKYINWYFSNEYFYAPSASTKAPVVNTSKSGLDDLVENEHTLPAVVWVGAKDKISNASILPKDSVIIDNDLNKQFKYRLPVKMEGVVNFWDSSSDDFFSKRNVRVTGEIQDQFFLTKTFWPIDYKLSIDSPAEALSNQEFIESFVREPVDFKTPYTQTVLWKNASSFNAPKYIVAFVLNGGEGNGRNGGHFSIGTGILEKDGDYSSILINNFYNLSDNDKGIIAAPTPLDKYLGDVNSGQSFYRSTYITFAVFDSPKVPQQIQSALNRLYVHYYRGDFDYHPALNNCSGISLDVVRALGWNVSANYPDYWWLSYIAYSYALLKNRDIDLAQTAMYFVGEESTRLLPAQVFKHITLDLLSIASNRSVSNTPMVNSIQKDLSSIHLVRIPQFPSARFLGEPPVFSVQEYLKRGRVSADQVNTNVFKSKPLPESYLDGFAKNKPKQKILLAPLAFFVTIMIIFILLSLFCIRKFLQYFKKKWPNKTKQFY